MHHHPSPPKTACTRSYRPSFRGRSVRVILALAALFVLAPSVTATPTELTGWTQSGVNRNLEAANETVAELGNRVTAVERPIFCWAWGGPNACPDQDPHDSVLWYVVNTATLGGCETQGWNCPTELPPPPELAPDELRCIQDASGPESNATRILACLPVDDVHGWIAEVDAWEDAVWCFAIGGPNTCPEAPFDSVLWFAVNKVVPCSLAGFPCPETPPAIPVLVPPVP